MLLLKPVLYLGNDPKHTAVLEDGHCRVGAGFLKESLYLGEVIVLYAEGHVMQCLFFSRHNVLRPNSSVLDLSDPIASYILQILNVPFGSKQASMCLLVRSGFLFAAIP